ncbi:MAG: ABC transporter ATP-binding protein [Lysobacterales bacterium]
MGRATLQTLRQSDELRGPFVLEAINLSKRYADTVALDCLNLRVEPGQICCLLGANGAGKTTTIHLFLNFISRSSGQALINGIDVVEAPLKSKAQLAYIPEVVNLYGSLSGEENLRYFSELAGRKLNRAEIVDLANQVGLAESAVDQRVSTYSKGMRQKVGIAIALAKQAKALIMDEPLSGLDPKAANEFSKLLKQVAEKGVATLMATHDVFRATEVGSHIGIMKHGQLVEHFAANENSHTDTEQLYLNHMRD